MSRRASTQRAAIIFPILAIAGLGSSRGLAQAPDYSAQIAPIFTKHCNGCHSATDADGELVLESYAQLRKGGKRGEEIVPGKSDESRLVLVLEGKAKPKMPPRDRPGPAAEEIALLKAWIDAGAPGPSAGAEALAAALVTPRIELTAPPRRAIYSAAFSRDGKWIALGRQGEVEILSAETRSPLRKIGGLPGPVNALAFTPDGGRVIAASGEPGLFGDARLWTLHAAATGGPAQADFRGHRDALYAVASSPDGKVVATAGYDSEIKLWDAKEGTELRTLKGHNGAVFDVAFRPESAILIIASASADRTVKIWNATTGARLDTFSQPLKDQNAAVFSPDGKRLAAGGADNRIRVWQISENGAEGSNPILFSRYAHEGAILKLVYSADGRYLASSADDRTVKIWDAASITERQLLEPQTDWPAALAFSADGLSLIVGRLDGTVGYYHTPTGQPVRLSSTGFGPARWVAGAIACALVLASPADPPQPEIASIEPRGLRLGTRAAFRISGKNLGMVKELKLSSGKLTGRIVDDPAPNEGELLIQLTAPADLERGGHDVWLVGPGGESNRTKVFVDDLPQLAESEPNDGLDAALGGPAFAASTPRAFWGSFDRRGDADYFPFEAASGETVVLDLAAASVGSKSNAVLAVLDPAGRVLASCNDFDGSPDPLIAFRAPAAGRYLVRATDLEMNASPEHFYRLSIGSFPFVAGSYPLGAPVGVETDVEIVGENIPPGTKVRVKPEAQGDVKLPIDASRFRSRRSLSVTAGSGSEPLEQEPNDLPANAVRVAAPCAANGRIGAPGDVDIFRFPARKGQTWIIEAEAARRGTPADTQIDVLDAGGRLVPRVRLQAVRDSYLSFRGINSEQSVDFRLKNWEEMELNELLFVQGEVLKLFFAPQGPDSGFAVYSLHGKRRTYFDTSATAHPLDEACYIVEPHPPGTVLVPNGLPMFDVGYTNDDDGDRALGTDSRLAFTPPADGDYLVRVSESSGHGGDRYAYRLSIRESKPGFQVTLSGANPSVGAGSGRAFSLLAERIDGFDGDITVRIDGLPPGFTSSSPIVIQAGHVEAQGTIFAELDAMQPTEASSASIRVTAEALVDGKKVLQDVNGIGKIQLEPRPKLLVRLTPMDGGKDITIAPGQMVPAMLKVERNGHDDLITFQVQNLPHGIIVDDIGLNGVLIRKGENERQIFLTAPRWVPETDRFCHAIENQAGSQTSPPVMVHVRKAGVAAKP